LNPTPIMAFDLITLRLNMVLAPTNIKQNRKESKGVLVRKRIRHG